MGTDKFPLVVIWFQNNFALYNVSDINVIFKF